MSVELQRAVNEYENFISEHGISEDVINAYVQAVQVAFLSEKDIEYGLKVSERAKSIIENFVLSKTGGTIWDLDSYCNKNKTQYSVLNNYYSVLKEEAPFLFHSYLLYLEKDREEEARFYSPKMVQLNKHGLIQAM